MTRFFTCRFSALFLFFTLFVSGLTTQAQTTIPVTSTDDSGPGTLREAITTANGNTALTYIITLPANQTITLTSALPAVLFSGTIAGGSTLCPATGEGGSTIARTGSAEFRLLLLDGTNKTMVIENVSFLNGQLGTAGSNVYQNRAGAGIQVSDLHDLTVRQCFFSKNSLVTIGGSAIYTRFGNLVVENSSFTDNWATAGVITTDYLTQSVRVSGCTFRQATPSSPPSTMLRLVGVSSGLVQNCTFHYTGADGYATSDIIYAEAYDVSLPTSVTVEHSTFNMPMTDFVYANAYYGNTSVFLRNNVFAQTTPSFKTFNTTGTATITSLGGNVFAKDISASLTLLPSDRNNVGTAGLALGSFTALSGPCVSVLPLLPGSAAIDAGVSSTLTTDTRGIARVGSPDAGAFESQGFTLAISSGNNQSALVGRAFSNPLRVVVSSPSGDPVDGTVVHFSAPATGASTTLNSTTATVNSGTAQVSATANATAGGPYNVTASVNGAIPASVEFALTNNSITLTGLTVSPGTVTSGNSVTFTATVGNVSGVYTFTLTNGVSTTTGARIPSAFSQTWAADCAGVQDFTLTVAQSGYSATATTPLTVTAHPDYAAVVDLFNSTNGPGWTNKIGWLQNCNPCRGWNGVVCSGAGRVTQLLLTNRNLVGTIPASLTALTNLQRLYLDQNQLTGSIPTSLESLTALQHLVTSYNSLTGSIPASLTGMSSLQRIILNDNQLTGSIPGSLSVLTNLRFLILSYNQLTGGIPDGLGSLPVLQYLYLNNNELTGNLPASLSALTNLITLDVNTNRLSGCYPAGYTVFGSSTTTDFSSNTALPDGGSAAGFTAFLNTGAGSDAFVASATASQTALCVGDAVSLSVNGGNTATVSWLAPAGVTLDTPATTSAISATATTSGLKTFTVTVSFGSSCSSTTTVSVSVVALPTATLTANLGGTLTCAQTSLTLTASGGTSYTFTGPGLSQSGSLSTAVANQAGIYSVTVANASGCTSTTTTTVLSNTTAPTVSISANSGTLTCAQTSLTLTATGGASYTFAGPGITSQNATAGTAVVNQAGTYTVTVANANGCTATSPTVISQSTGAPTAGLVSSGTITCTVTAITLTASGGNSYSFAGLGVVASAGSSATVNVDGVYSVTVTNTATGCSSVTSTTVSSNTTAPTVGLAASNSLNCSIASTTLSATATGFGSLTYTFLAAGGSLPGSPSSNSTVVVTTGGSYSVLVTAANGCTVLQSTSVTSNTGLPTASLVASGSINCTQTSVTLTASGGTSYTFANASGTLGTPGSASTLVVSAGGTYSVTVGNANGCISITTATVLSNTTAPTVSISATSGTLTCAVTTLTLTATSSETGLLWNNAATTTSITVNSAGTYSVTATGTNGCSAVSNSVTIGSNTTAPTGANLTASNSGTLTCSVQTLTLTATATGSGLSYAFAGPSGTIVGSGNTRNVSASGLYSVTITGANGCTTSASTTVFSNTATPMVSIAPTSGTLTCAAPSLTLTATASGTGVRWSTNETTLSIVISTSGTYSVTATAANGCTSTTNVTINTNLAGASGAPTLSASSSVVCAGANVMVVATVSGSPTGLQWYRNGLLVAGQTSATLSLGGVQSAQAGSYVLVVTGACSVTSTPFNLTVNPLPTVTLLVQQGANVQGSSITLPAPLTSVNFQVMGGIAFERLIVVDRINGFEIRQVDSNTNGIFPVTRTGPFRLTVTDGNGCQRTVEGVISMRP
jgi:hypothetical protein